MLSEKLHQLNTLVLCDTPEREMPDAFYIFSEPNSHLEMLTKIAVSLAKPHGIKIALSGGVDQGYDFRFWLKALREYGINEEDIVLIAQPEQNLNTLSESEKLAQHAKMFGWKNIWITAPAFQQLRTFMSLVTAVKKEFHLAKIYNIPGLPLKWHKEMVHYQGEVKGRPLDFILSEAERIQKYIAQGDILPVEQILKYFEERESL